MTVQILMWVWFDFEEFLLLDDFLCKFWYGFCLFFKNFHFFAWLFDNFDAISNMGQWFYFGLFAILMHFFLFFYFFMLVCFDSQGFWLGCVVHMQILMWVLALKDFVCVELNFWCNLVIFQFLDLFMLFIQTPKWGVWSFFSLFGIGGWWWLLVLLWPWILVAGGYAIDIVIVVDDNGEEIIYYFNV